MKNIIILSLLLFFLSANGFTQTEKASVLQTLEQSGQGNLETGKIATLSSASRLFGEKDDLTAVIFVLPIGSTVEVLGVDSTYLFVKYEDTKGYIFNRNVTIEQVNPGVTSTQATDNSANQQQNNNLAQQNNDQSLNRLTILQNKYGSSIAASLYAGKIWKGIATEMVKDSWGTPVKINRSINANLVKEEWIFNNTWLFFENDRLIDWGPVNR